MDTGDPRRALRESYDAIATDYVARLRDELSYKPLDRALLSMLVEAVGLGASCGDLGCGPGHVSGWLAARGVQLVGIDLSPGMLDIARQEHPDVEFRQGDLVELPAADEEFALVVALYSIIHLEPEARPRAFSEMRRVLRPGGAALVAFHVGDEVRHVTDWWGHPVDVEGRYLPTAHVAAEMEDAGLAVRIQIERVNYPQEVPTRRAYLVGERAP